MTAQELWDIIRWVTLPGIAGVLWLIWRLRDELKKDMTKELDQRFESMEDKFDQRVNTITDIASSHQIRDDVNFKTLFDELEASRKWATAFQVEAGRIFASREEVKESNAMTQASLSRIEGSVNMLTQHLLTGGHKRDSGGG